VPDERLTFGVDGPYEVLTENGRGGRFITAEAGPELFERTEDLGESVGCYVYGLRSGGGITPWYVGKTTSGFRWECFQPHKLNKFNEALAKTGHGTPVIFFVVHPRARGRANASAIGELEVYLIQTAFIRNPGLLNRTRTEGPTWAIQGLGVGRGRPPNSVVQLARALGIG
jgi:hypothetical protein